MRKFLPLFLLIVILTLSFLALFLFLRSQTQTLPGWLNQLSDKRTSEREVAGEVDISRVDLPADRPYRSIAINGATVTDTNKGSLKQGENKFDKVDLTVSFLEKGFERELTFSLVDKVNYIEFLEDESTKYWGIIPVADVPLKKGDDLTLVVAYIPEGKTNDREKFDRFCESSDEPICGAYSKLGFGDKPTDANAYWESLADSRQLSVDYTVFAVNSIFGF